MTDKIVSLLDHQPESGGDDIVSLMEESYKQLLRDMSSGTEKGDGASGSLISIADRVRILTSVREFLQWRGKLKPEKAQSGISQLRERLSDGSAGRARRGS